MGFVFVLVAVLAAAAAILFFTPRRILELFARTTPDVLYFARTSEKIVALTIDDGPSTETPKILGVLSRYNASATFFLISERVRSGGEGVVRDMVRWGHEIGNHLTHDERSVNLPLGEFEKKLVGGRRSAEGISGHTVDAPGWCDV